MKQISLFLILILIFSLLSNVDGFSKFTPNKKEYIEIDFQSSFYNELVYLYVNNKLVFKGMINTDPDQGFAHTVKIKKPNKEQYSIKVKISKCDIKEQTVDSKWGFVGINYFGSTCNIEYSFSEKDFVYF